MIEGARRKRPVNGNRIMMEDYRGDAWETPPFLTTEAKNSLHLFRSVMGTLVKSLQSSGLCSK